MVSFSDFLSLFFCGLALFSTDLVTNNSYGMTYSILIHRGIVVTDAKFKSCSFAGNVYLVLFTRMSGESYQRRLRNLKQSEAQIVRAESTNKGVN